MLCTILITSGCSIFGSSREGVPRAKRPTASSAKTVKLSSARRYIGRLLWPVRGAELSSRFGDRWLSFHEGIDLSAPEGTPIYAAHDGIVVYSDDSIRGYGNVIVLRAEGLLTVYAHNRRNKVSKGQSVHRGDKIAEVGKTGKATGPHCHFETRIKDTAGQNVAVDPLVFFPGEK
ncbi:MAG: M23 family metallopeptidase [Oligoflexia bacterium]|nr:M23 family metallopeptidase [Oligoflexia bacterium]